MFFTLCLTSFFGDKFYWLKPTFVKKTELPLAAMASPHRLASWHPRCGKMWSLVNWLQLFRRILQMDPRSMGRFCRSWRKIFFQEPSVPLACEFILFFFGWQCHSYFVVWKMVVVTVSSLFLVNMRSLDHGWRYQDAYHWYNFSNCRSIMLLPGWQHPQFMAYYPSSSSVPAILSETVIASIGSVGLQWKSNPIGTELEVVVMDPRCLWWLGVCVCFSEKGIMKRDTCFISSTTPNPSHRKISNNGIGCKDWVAKFLNLGPAFHHTSGVGGGIIQNTAGEVT